MTPAPALDLTTSLRGDFCTLQLLLVYQKFLIFMFFSLMLVTGPGF